MSYVRVRDSARRVNGKPVKRYQAVWFENGRRYTETFDTRELADNKLDRVKTLLLQGKSPASLRELGSETFRAVAAEWLATRHDVKRRTRAGHREKLRPADQRKGDMRTLGIDAVFGDKPVNEIRRSDLDAWVAALTRAGKSPTTVKHHFSVVKMVLDQAVADGRIITNPAEYVKLPSERSLSGGTPGVVDDPDMFLTASQVAALVDATPWPCSVMVHVAAWAGLRAGELAGLQVGDVELPARSISPNGPIRRGVLHVERTVIVDADDDAGIGEPEYETPKTKGSRRTVPMTAETTELLRAYRAEHPRADEPTAPLFPAVQLDAPKPPSAGGPRNSRNSRKDPEHWRVVAARQADTLAALSVDEAAARLVLDWSSLFRYGVFYKSVFRPAVLRANRLAAADIGLSPESSPVLPPGLVFKALRHTYASLCVAAGIPPLHISRFMGHSRVTTTLTVYAHLFEDDHSETMAALEAMSAPSAPNVTPLRRRRG